MPTTATLPAYRSNAASTVEVIIESRSGDVIAIPTGSGVYLTDPATNRRVYVCPNLSCDDNDCQTGARVLATLIDSPAAVHAGPLPVGPVVGDAVTFALGDLSAPMPEMSGTVTTVQPDGLIVDVSGTGYWVRRDQLKSTDLVTEVPELGGVPTNVELVPGGQLRPGDVITVAAMGESLRSFLSLGMAASDRQIATDELLTVTSIERNTDDTNRVRFTHRDGRTNYRYFHTTTDVPVTVRGPETATDYDAPTGAVARALEMVGIGGRVRSMDSDHVYTVEVDNRRVVVRRDADGRILAAPSDDIRWERVDAPTMPAPTTPPVTSVPAPTISGAILPRNAADAVQLASALQDLARWLPGGELNTAGHEHAAQANLCGEYEAIVCPTFGWTPRNGNGSSMARRTGTFFDDMDRFERDNADLSPLARVQKWAERYERGGFANMAVTEHAENHLEDHKREGANELLETVLNWDPIGDAEREYVVYVDVVRTINVTQRVAIPVTATNEDAAENQVDTYAVYDAVDDSEWTTDNGDTVSASTSQYDIEDYTVDEVEAR